MIERYGVSGMEADGVFFTEKSIDGALPIKHIAVRIKRQNSNLSAVKAQMAREARSAKATALMNFKYGQKKHFIGWDSESWWGEADAVAPEGDLGIQS